MPRPIRAPRRSYRPLRPCMPFRSRRGNGGSRNNPRLSRRSVPACRSSIPAGRSPPGILRGSSTSARGSNLRRRCIRPHPPGRWAAPSRSRRCNSPSSSSSRWCIGSRSAGNPPRRRRRHRCPRPFRRCPARRESCRGVRSPRGAGIASRCSRPRPKGRRRIPLGRRSCLRRRSLLRQRECKGPRRSIDPGAGSSPLR